MKTRLIASLVIGVILVAGLVMPATAEVYTRTATVTVQQYISSTITDYGGAGLNFGTLPPGASAGWEANQSSEHGAVTINVSRETNVICNIQIKGSGNFSDGSGHSFDLGNAKWDDDFNTVDATAMTTDWVVIDYSTPGVEKIVNVWHTLSIPFGQYTATYNTTFIYGVI